jgi:hypothetical protein
MATPTTFASQREFVGIAKEASGSQGTPVAMTNTLRVTSFDATAKAVKLEDTSMQGDMAELHDVIAGVSYVEISMGGPLLADDIGWPLAGILGDLVTTGAADPFSTAIALNNGASNQPPSYTLTDFDGVPASVGARQFPGAVFSEVGISWQAEGLAAWTAKLLGFPSVIPGGAPTASPSTLQALAAWRMKVGIAGPASGGTLVTNVESGELTITREVKAIFTGQGTQSPFIIRGGKVGAAWKMAMIATDETHWINYLTNVQPQLQWVLDNGVVGAGQNQIKLDAQKIAYTDDPKRNRSDVAVAFEVGGKLIANSTNAGASGGKSPCKLTVINALPSGTYV